MTLFATIKIFFVIGVLFGSAAALMAYLITYNEWAHHYAEKKIPKKTARESALFAFIFFVALTLCIGYILASNGL